MQRPVCMNHIVLYEGALQVMRQDLQLGLDSIKQLNDGRSRSQLGGMLGRARGMRSRFSHGDQVVWVRGIGGDAQTSG